MEPFSPDFDRHGVAARLRQLLSVPRERDPEIVAEELRVGELALRISIDPDSPHPTIEVMIAVIRQYGVDPTWLLTGEYDGKTHRQALDDIGQVRRLFTTPRTVTRGATPVASFEGIHPDVGDPISEIVLDAAAEAPRQPPPPES